MLPPTAAIWTTGRARGWGWNETCRRANNPGFQDAIDLQAKVVVEAGGIVPLHTKRGFGRRRALTGRRRRFGRFLEAAFRGVLVERHNPLTSFHLHLIRLCSILKTITPPEGSGGIHMAASVWKGHLIFGMRSEEH